MQLLSSTNPASRINKWIEADIAMDFPSKEAQPCRAFPSATNERL